MLLQGERATWMGNWPKGGASRHPKTHAHKTPVSPIASERHTEEVKRRKIERYGRKEIRECFCEEREALGWGTEQKGAALRHPGAPGAINPCAPNCVRERNRRRAVGSHNTPEPRCAKTAAKTTQPRNHTAHYSSQLHRRRARPMAVLNSTRERGALRLYCRAYRGGLLDHLKNRRAPQRRDRRARKKAGSG